jgi:hypothetical protein
MIDILNFILASLMVWRVSSLIAREDGPMDIFSRFKAWIYRLSYPGNGHVPTKMNKILDSFYRGLNCMWCNSVWFSAIASIFISSTILEWVAKTLSISTVVIMIETAVKGRK